MRTLKTITLGFGDNPTVSLCPGHVGPRIFTKAFEAEGWSGGGDFTKADLKHEFWIKQKRGWKRSVDGDVDSRGRKAQPVTISEW